MGRVAPLVLLAALCVGCSHDIPTRPKPLPPDAAGQPILTGTGPGTAFPSKKISVPAK